MKNVVAAPGKWVDVPDTDMQIMQDSGLVVVVRYRDKSDVRRILDKSEFIALKDELGVRPDWHEPDEQEVTASVAGDMFDNAGFWPKEHVLNSDSTVELYVTFEKNGVPIAQVNLATLCGWASE